MSDRQLAETVIVAGRTLHAPHLACRPVQPLDYPPDMLRRWKTASARAGFEPTVDPDDAESVCEVCGITVAVGRRQAVMLDLAATYGLAAHVACLVCAATVERAPRFMSLDTEPQRGGVVFGRHLPRRS